MAEADGRVGYTTHVTCRRCGGGQVQVAQWVRVNTDEIVGDYGSWDSTDTTWCEDCEDHTGVRTAFVHHPECDPDADCTCGASAAAEAA